MFRLEKRFRFEAAHYLPHHDGKCARLHGHSWVGTLIVEGEGLQDSGVDEKNPKAGMVMDFGDLSAVINPLVEEYLDHQYLNLSIQELVSPTSEELARWVYNQLKGSLPLLAAVRIEETCTSAAEYRP